MAPPSPYFRTDEEKQALIKMRDGFAERLKNEETPGNLTIVIAGVQGEGKTHTACEMAGIVYGEVYLADTEARAHHVTQKFGTHVHRFTIRSYMEAVAFVKWLKRDVKPPATVVFDSVTDLDKFAEEQYLIHEDKEVVGKPINHPKMNRYVYALLDELKFSGFTIVLTAKMKDEYQGDNRTGKMLPRVFKDIPYRSDFIIEIVRGEKFCLKSPHTGNARFPLQTNKTLPELIEHLLKIDRDRAQLLAQPTVPAALPVSESNNGGRKLMRI
jgi:hypothetical protein